MAKNDGKRKGLRRRYRETWRVALTGRDSDAIEYDARERLLAALFVIGAAFGGTQAIVLGYNLYKAREIVIYEKMGPIRDLLPDQIEQPLTDVKRHILEPAIKDTAGFLSQAGEVFGSALYHVRDVFSDPAIGAAAGFGAAVAVAGYIALHNRKAERELY